MSTHSGIEERLLRTRLPWLQRESMVRAHSEAGHAYPQCRRARPSGTHVGGRRGSAKRAWPLHRVPRRPEGVRQEAQRTLRRRSGDGTSRSCSPRERIRPRRTPRKEELLALIVRARHGIESERARPEGSIGGRKVWVRASFGPTAHLLLRRGKGGRQAQHGQTSTTAGLSTSFTTRAASKPATPARPGGLVGRARASAASGEGEGPTRNPLRPGRSGFGLQPSTPTCYGGSLLLVCACDH